MKILHETAEYAVILKPAGMLSQGAPGEEGDAVSLLSKLWGKPAYPVHRLDRSTGGVMVYAKSKKSAAALCEAIAQGRMQKEYLAVCHGACPEEGEMKDLLFHRSAGNKSFVVDRMRAGVKDAELSYQRLETISVPEKLSLVRVFLKTGRTHQIRVQFAHRGYPLYGDRKYGAHSPGEARLFCAKLTFPEPKSGKAVSFSALPQEDIWDYFKELGE